MVIRGYFISCIFQVLKITWKATLTKPYIVRRNAGSNRLHYWKIYLKVKEKFDF